MNHTATPPPSQQRFLARLGRDRRGNVAAMIAAAMFPLLGLVGSGIDMGRGYLAESRLQQACDAGVLAARKTIGSAVIDDGLLPDDAATAGNRFFNQNFRADSYGTENRTFAMELETDLSVTGLASVDVPTTVMSLFGFDDLPISVACASRLNFSNVDVMFVLDVTGSMRHTNLGDSMSRIEAMRTVVRSFYDTLEESSGTGTRLRYGFVPYATNVNVGEHLQSDWLVDEWHYQSRTPERTGTTTVPRYDADYDEISGDKDPITEYLSPTCPTSTNVPDYDDTVEVSTSPHIYYYESVTNGTEYYCTASDGQFVVSGWVYTDYRQRSTFTENGTTEQASFRFDYERRTIDVSSTNGATGSDPAELWSTIELNISHDVDMETHWWDGCIEERATYRIFDYDDVDLDRALDLDINLVPDPADEDTQWRPRYQNLVFARNKAWDNSGIFWPFTTPNTTADYVRPGWVGQISTCPTAARKMAEMDVGEIDSYLASLTPAGQTYHDIGMIWGGRLLSQNGLFATENADVSAGNPTSRHLIFLTDGQTESMDLAYGAYGIEPIDMRRRWPIDPMTLNQTIEARFLFACNQVKENNTTVWVVAFGTTVNASMVECAGAGRYFEADDAIELDAAFQTIAESMGDLRLSQ